MPITLRNQTLLDTHHMKALSLPDAQDNRNAPNEKSTGERGL
ncbi:hypothetical protein ACFSJQ_23065 [Vibrio olivae]